MWTIHTAYLLLLCACLNVRAYSSQKEKGEYASREHKAGLKQEKKKPYRTKGERYHESKSTKAIPHFQHGHFIGSDKSEICTCKRSFYFEYVRCRRLVIKTWRGPGG